MAVNKVDYNGSTLIDISSDTVTAGTLLAGETAHDATGAAVTGTMQPGDYPVYNDGKLHFYFNIAQDCNKTVRHRYNSSVVGGLTIDWGDGTSETNIATGVVTATHTYSALGEYHVVWTVNSGTVTLPSNVVECENDWWNRTVLASIEITASAVLSNYAFNYQYGCRQITIHGTGRTSLPNYFLGYNACKTVVVPDGVKTLGTNCLQYSWACSKLILPDSLETIGASALRGYVALGEVHVPANVTSIGDSAFYGNSNTLAWHIKPNTPPTLGTNVFTGLRSVAKIYVPSASLTAYQTAANWSDWASYMAGE